MKPSLKSFEREEEEILADYDAGYITEHEKNKAIKDLWKEYNLQRMSFVNDDEWEDWND